MTLRAVNVCALFFGLISATPVAPTTATTAQEQTLGTLKGTLLDPQGAAVANSDIELRWNDVGDGMCWTPPHCPSVKRPRKKLLHVITDAADSFSLTVTPGNWDIFAYRDSYAPTCDLVWVDTGKATTIELRFTRFGRMQIQ